MSDVSTPAAVRGLAARFGPAIGAALAALAVDQASKLLMLRLLAEPPHAIPVLPVFSLTLGFNEGVSFGMFASTFADVPWLLAGLKLAIVAGLAVWLLTARSALERVALGLIVGGALGNVLDRLRIGAVVDFLDLHWQGWRWPTFNLADVAVVGGALGLVLASSWPGRQDAATRSAPTEQR